MKTSMFQHYFELCGFIEYVGRLPTRDSAMTRGHYIGYRQINFEWIRSDDTKCHRTHIQGDYKVNMAFYRSMSSTTVSDFILDTEGILFWQKSVVIRGVYKPHGKRGCGQGTSKASTRTKSGETSMGASLEGAEEISLDDFYIFGDSTSPDKEDGVGMMILILINCQHYHVTNL